MTGVFSENEGLTRHLQLLKEAKHFEIEIPEHCIFLCPEGKFGSEWGFICTCKEHWFLWSVSLSSLWYLCCKKELFTFQLKYTLRCEGEDLRQKHNIHAWNKILQSRDRKTSLTDSGVTLRGSFQIFHINKDTFLFVFFWTKWLKTILSRSCFTGCKDYENSESLFCNSKTISRWKWLVRTATWGAWPPRCTLYVSELDLSGALKKLFLSTWLEWVSERLNLWLTHMSMPWLIKVKGAAGDHQRESGGWASFFKVSQQWWQARFSLDL